MIQPQELRWLACIVSVEWWRTVGNCFWGFHGRMLSLGMKWFLVMINTEKVIKPDWITLLPYYQLVTMLDLQSSALNISVQWWGIKDLQLNLIACMVDLLGRAAGKFVEAVDLIEKMPFKPHAAIFGTLLSACRTHKNTEIEEILIQRLQLDMYDYSP